MKSLRNRKFKTSLSSRGQVVIPVEVRQQLGLRAGSDMLVTPRADGVIELRPINTSLDELFNLYPVEPAESNLADADAIQKVILEKDTRSKSSRHGHR